MLVQTGTLRVGDAFVVGTFSGRVRALFNDAGRSVKEAGPAIPAEVVGLLGVPMAGDEFVVTKDERIAREIAESRLAKQRTAGMAPVRKVTLDDLFSQMAAGTVKDLGLVIRADVQGSAEAIADSIEPTLKERVLGRAEVRQVFTIPKAGAVAGCYVTDGTIVRAGSSVRVVRDGVVVYEGKMGSLRRFKDDVKEVATGYECGIGVENFNDIKPGDRLEVFTIDKIATKL